MCLGEVYVRGSEKEVYIPYIYERGICVLGAVNVF
jgi:hypothetical protein